LFTTTSSEKDAQITMCFDLMKIALLKKRLRAHFESLHHDTKHNDVQQSYIEPLFSSRAGADPESECWYDFEGFCQNEEDGGIFSRAATDRPQCHHQHT
jgi:hypothetical protein